MDYIYTAFEKIKQTAPIVHCITNYVTVNDVANALLAIGASPIMADDVAESAEITAICSALYINIGTLNERTIHSMIAAGKRANQLGHPVVLDPVGVGASNFRTETALKLLNEIQFTAIRGNISEIKTLALGTHTTQGVDAADSDKLRLSHLEADTADIKALAKKLKTLIIVSGQEDIITDGDRLTVGYNGHAMMKNVTGTGCQLGAIVTAFIAVGQEGAFESAVAAVTSYGLCGQIAYDRIGEKDGNITYRNYVIDALFKLTSQQLKEGARYEDY